MFSNCERDEQNEKEVEDTVNHSSSEMMDTDEMLVVVYSKSLIMVTDIQIKFGYAVLYILHIQTVWNICPLYFFVQPNLGFYNYAWNL